MGKPIIVILSIYLLLVACSSEPETVTVRETVEVPVTVEVTVEVAKEVEVEVTREVENKVEVEIEVTRILEVTRIVEEVVVATPTMQPMPEVFVEIEGSGNLITDNFHWSKCSKTVFYSSETGPTDNFAVHLHLLGSDRDQLIANVISPAEDTRLAEVVGGTYFFEINAPTGGNWTIRGECQG